MVTSADAPRPSLRRRMANATPVPPKAACRSDAFCDHQSINQLRLIGSPRAPASRSSRKDRIGSDAGGGLTRSRSAARARSMNSFGASRLRIIQGASSIALVLSAGLGCSPKDDAGSPSSGSPEEQLIQGLCDGLASCCGGAKLAFDRAGCESQAHLTISSRKPSSNKAVLDTAAVTECAAQARQAIGQCSAVPKDGACARMYVGTVATNASCTESEECAPVSGAEVFCSGVCYAVRRGALGDACEADCQDASCTPSVARTNCSVEDSLVCINGKCTNAPTAGQPCTSGHLRSKAPSARLP